ncbi:unnamed protein product, partial [Polarella glacialis]
RAWQDMGGMLGTGAPPPRVSRKSAIKQDNLQGLRPSRQRPDEREPGRRERRHGGQKAPETGDTPAVVTE